MSCQCIMFWVTRQWELVRAVVRHSELSVYKGRVRHSELSVLVYN